VREHAGRVPFQPGLDREDHVTLAFAHLTRQRRGARRRVDKFLVGSRRVRETEVAEREVLVRRDRLLVVAAGIGRAKLLGEVAPLQVRLPRLFGCRRDRNLVGRGLRLSEERRAGAERDEQDARECPSAHWDAAHRTPPGRLCRGKAYERGGGAASRMLRIPGFRGRERPQMVRIRRPTACRSGRSDSGPLCTRA
jgi:hypothetical protein